MLGERIISIKAGFQYRPTTKLFIEPQAGYARIRNEDMNGKHSAINTFNYAINVGYLLNKNFEISARYEDYLRKGHLLLPNIGIRFAYRFKL